MVRTIKIALAGAEQVGKTSIIGMITKGSRGPVYASTWGVETTYKYYLSKDTNVIYYDLGGASIFQPIVEVYPNCATIVGFVYNTNKPETFDHACKLHTHYKDKGYLKGKMVYLIANEFGTGASNTGVKSGTEYAGANNLNFLLIKSSDDVERLMPAFFDKLNIKESTNLCLVL